MSGKLKTKGNMMLATKLDGVLKVSYKLSHPARKQLEGMTHSLSLFRLQRPRLSSKREVVVGLVTLTSLALSYCTLFSGSCAFMRVHRCYTESHNLGASFQGVKMSGVVCIAIRQRNKQSVPRKTPRIVPEGIRSGVVGRVELREYKA